MELVIGDGRRSSCGIDMIGTLVFTPLDVFRLHLLRRSGIVTSSLGLVLYIASWAFITRVLRENARRCFAVPCQPTRANPSNISYFRLPYQGPAHEHE